VDYAWLVSLVFTLVGVSACRRSNMGGLKVFQFGILGEFRETSGVDPELFIPDPTSGKSGEFRK
jgi:hypothetical protein